MPSRRSTAPVVPDAHASASRKIRSLSSVVNFLRFGRSATSRSSDRGDLDPGSLRKRAKQKVEDQALQCRNAELERENRKLHHRLERAELILEIQKKAQGLLRELESPEDIESER